MLSVLSGAWVFHVVRANLATARDLAGQFLEAATAEGVASAGHFPLGSSLFHLGRFAESRAHMESVLQGPGGSHPSLKLFAGPDIGVFSRSYMGHNLWHLGFVEQSAQASREAIAAAQEKAHPFSMAIALDYAALLHVFRRESAEALARAEEAAAVCRRHGFAYYLSMAEVVAGWAQAQAGEHEAGLARLRQGMEALRATGAEIRLAFYYGLLAETCALAGQTGQALANISSGFAFQSKSGEIWAASGLHRLQGDLLRASGNDSAASESYQRALDVARQSGARTPELRAAVRLWWLERSAEARSVVDRLAGEFTEGFDTRDLQEARTLEARARR